MATVQGRGECDRHGCAGQNKSAPLTSPVVEFPVSSAGKSESPARPGSPAPAGSPAPPGSSTPSDSVDCAGYLRQPGVGDKQDIPQVGAERGGCQTSIASQGAVSHLSGGKQFLSFLEDKLNERKVCIYLCLS